MSLITRILDRAEHWLSGESKTIDVVSDRIVWQEARAADASFPIYSESIMNGNYIGISDQDYVSEREQRIHWRGVFAACVQMRADQIAPALCKAQVKRKIADGEYEDVEEMHPWKVLWNDPAKGYDRFFFFEQMSKLRDWGRGAHLPVFRWSRDEPDKGRIRGVPAKLGTIYPYFGDVRVQGGIDGDIAEFIFHSRGGPIEHIPPEELIWMRHGHPVTPFESCSLLLRGAFESDTSLFQSQYMRDMSKEGHIPHVYATTDLNITPKQSEEFGRLLTKEYRTAGISNRKTLFLGNGTRLETIAMSPDEMQAIDSMNLNNHQIYVICGIPPEIMTEGGTLANSSEGRRKWLQNSIQPEVDKICESFTAQLKVAFDAEGSDLCIVPPNVIPVDPLEQERIRELKLRTGQRTPNEFRLEDGMEEYAGGEMYFLGGGLRPVRDFAQEEQEQETETIQDE